MQPADCSWLPKLVAQFEHMPHLAIVGMNAFQLGHGEGNDRNANAFMDPATKNNMIFAFQVRQYGVAVNGKGSAWVAGGGGVGGVHRARLFGGRRMASARASHVEGN